MQAHTRTRIFTVYSKTRLCRAFVVSAHIWVECEWSGGKINCAQVENQFLVLQAAASNLLVIRIHIHLMRGTQRANCVCVFGTRDV